MNTKNCKVCKDRLPLTEFYRHPTYKDGLTVICKTCTLKYDRERVIKHPGPQTTGTKICTTCKQEKIVGEFTKRLRSKDGLRNRCKVCDRSAGKLYRICNPNQRRLAKLRQQYGLSKEAYEKLLVDQNYRCKICSELTKLVVDHCHTTLVVRGLLCHKCNAGLGFFEENTEKLQQAIKYLEIRYDKMDKPA